MTVKELIKELKKWPGHWQVACAAHDNSDDEIQHQVNHASELEPGMYYDDLGDTVVLRD